MIGAALALAATFTPPVLQSAALGPVPYGARAAGVVVLEAEVDERGAVTAVRAVKTVAPFSEGLERDVRDWRFEPAREDLRTVRSRVLVAALVRPAALLFPAPGAPPTPPTHVPEDIPYPVSVAVPPYPPNAVGDAAVIVETSVATDGSVDEAHVVSEPGGFDLAALEAARGWRFRAAHHDGRAVESRAYLVFVFRSPVTPPMASPGPR